MRYRTISQIGTFTALSNDLDDYLAIAPSRCSGGTDAPLRTTIDDAPGEPGALILPPLASAQVITIGGDLVVTSTGFSAEPGYRETVEALLAELKSALDAAATAPIALVHSGGTLKVWKYSPLDDSWDDLETICAVTFSLVVDVFV